MCDQDTARIPLRARDGSIRAYALVDAADADFVNQWTWCLSRDGYATRNLHQGEVGGTQIRLHRVLLGLEYGDPRKGDHKDLDRLNNRRSNLRIVTQKANSQNRGGHPNSTSDHRGVGWDRSRGKWMAYLKIDRRFVNLGRFDSEIEAAGMALTGRLEYMEGALS
jgi:hypothetical protein